SGTIAIRLPRVIGVAMELMLNGLENDSAAVAEVALLIVVLTVKVAPAILETAPVKFKRLGLYWRVKLPEVTLRPLLRATGMPLSGMLLAALIVASEVVTPGVVEVRS